MHAPGGTVRPKELLGLVIVWLTGNFQLGHQLLGNIFFIELGVRFFKIEITFEGDAVVSRIGKLSITSTVTS